MSYVLIDCTNYKAIARCNSYRALCDLAFIQYANVDTVVHPTTENKHYAQFDAGQLQSIYDSVLDASAVKGVAFKTAGVTYGDTIATVRALIEAAPALHFPVDPSLLEAQAAKIEHGDDRPYAINPVGNMAKRLQKWAVEPNRNRPRNAPGTSEQLTRKAAAPVAPLVSKKPKQDSDTVPELTAKAHAEAPGCSYADFIKAGWTDGNLMSHGYVVFVGPGYVMDNSPKPKKTRNEKAASKKRVRTPDERMTRKAKGMGHEDFINAGWNDEQLVAKGYMLAE